MTTLPSNISSLSEAEELDHRMAAYEKDPPTGATWEQVKAGLPKR